MSDYLPSEIQSEIMKKLPVKSLIQFRSVSKPWRSLIDSSRFITDYSGQQHLLVRSDLQFLPDEPQYLSIVDDDTFPEQKVSPTVPQLVKMLEDSKTIGCSHGLLCLYGNYDVGFDVPTVVLWNVSIRKACAVAVPNVGKGVYKTSLGFGVCHETSDPKIVKITHIDSWKAMESISSIPWQVEVFTLSTGAWRTPYSTNLPRKSIEFRSEQVVIDGLLYWIVTDWITTDGGFRCLNLIMSFDLASEKFREISLPDALAHHQPIFELSSSKLRESLVVLQRCGDVDDRGFHVWMMEDGVPKSFSKTLTISTPGAKVLSVLEFRKSGESIIHILDDLCDLNEDETSLVVFEPSSKHISNLGISGWLCWFYVHSYMETLLLLDQPDLTPYDI